MAGVPYHVQRDLNINVPLAVQNALNHWKGDKCRVCATKSAAGWTRDRRIALQEGIAAGLGVNYNDLEVFEQCFSRADTSIVVEMKTAAFDRFTSSRIAQRAGSAA